jgi:hypothetical protein
MVESSEFCICGFGSARECYRVLSFVSAELDSQEKGCSRILSFVSADSDPQATEHENSEFVLSVDKYPQEKGCERVLSFVSTDLAREWPLSRLQDLTL